MKRYIASSIFVISVGISSPAMAQSEWTGPYIGIYSDVSSEEVGFEDFGCWSACSKVTLQGNDINGGFAAGFDAQVADSFVIGVVGEIGTGSKRSLTAGANLSTTSAGTVTYQSDTSRHGSLRARAGLASGRTLIYVTGGVTLAKAKRSVEVQNAPVWDPTHSANYAATWNGNLHGTTFGAGIEFKLSAVSVKAEVLTSQYSTSSSCFTNMDGTNAGVCWTSAYVIPPQMNTTSRQTAIRLGVNYRF